MFGACCSSRQAPSAKRNTPPATIPEDAPPPAEHEAVTPEVVTHAVVTPVAIPQEEPTEVAAPPKVSALWSFVNASPMSLVNASPMSLVNESPLAPKPAAATGLGLERTVTTSANSVLSCIPVGPGYTPPSTGPATIERGMKPGWTPPSSGAKLEKIATREDRLALTGVLSCVAPEQPMTPGQQNADRVQQVLTTPNWMATLKAQGASAAVTESPALRGLINTSSTPRPAAALDEVSLHSCSDDHPLRMDTPSETPISTQRPPATPRATPQNYCPTISDMVATPAVSGGPSLCRVDVAWKKKLGKFSKEMQLKLVTQLVCAGTDREWAQEMVQCMKQHHGRMSIRGPLEDYTHAFNVFSSIPSLTVNVNTPSKVPQDGVPRATGKATLETPPPIGTKAKRKKQRKQAQKTATREVNPKALSELAQILKKDKMAALAAKNRPAHSTWSDTKESALSGITGSALAGLGLALAGTYSKPVEKEGVSVLPSPDRLVQESFSAKDSLKGRQFMCVIETAVSKLISPSSSTLATLAPGSTVTVLENSWWHGPRIKTAEGWVSLVDNKGAKLLEIVPQTPAPAPPAADDDIGGFGEGKRATPALRNTNSKVSPPHGAPAASKKGKKANKAKTKLPKKSQVVGPAGRGVGALLVGTDAPKAEAGLKPKVNTAKARANKAQRNRAVGGNRPGPSKKEAAKPPVLGTRRSNLKVTTRARTQIVEQVVW